jgi:hypothetical protein
LLASSPYAAIPPLVRNAVLRYVEHRIPPGSAVRSLFENDLRGFIGRADEDTLAAVRPLMWTLSECPNECQGSPEKVEKWLAARVEAHDEPDHERHPSVSGLR